MSKFLILAVITIFISCGINSNKENKIRATRTYYIELPYIKTKSAAAFSSVDLVYDKKSNKPILAYLLKADSQFYYVDVFSKKIIKKINFKSMAKKLGLNAYFSPFYIGLDSILILSENDKNIYLIHNNKIEFQTSVYANEYSPQNYEPLSLSQFNILYSNNCIYVVTTYNDMVLNNMQNIKKYFNRLPELGISITNKQYFRLGKFPSNYLTNFYYDCYPIRCINNHNELVYSFRNNDTLFVYNKQKLVKFVSAKSKYDNAPHATMPIDAVDKISKVKEYNLAAARYEKIVYDPFKNCYYRVFKPSQNFLNEQNQIKQKKELNWVLMVLDSNLNVQAEHLFTKGEYNYKWMLPTQNGLLVSSTCESCQNRDLLKFTLLQTHESQP